MIDDGRWTAGDWRRTNDEGRRPAADPDPDANFFRETISGTCAGWSVRSFGHGSRLLSPGLQHTWSATII